jgi:hypothetical protein
VKDPAHIFDLNATILNRLGIDPAKLTYRYQGRDFRLTDVRSGPEGRCHESRRRRVYR